MFVAVDPRQKKKIAHGRRCVLPYPRGHAADVALLDLKGEPERVSIALACANEIAGNFFTNSMALVLCNNRPIRLPWHCPAAASLRQSSRRRRPRWFGQSCRRPPATPTGSPRRQSRQARRSGQAASARFVAPGCPDPPTMHEQSRWLNETRSNAVDPGIALARVRPQDCGQAANRPPWKCNMRRSPGCRGDRRSTRR